MKFALCTLVMMVALAVSTYAQDLGGTLNFAQHGGDSNLAYQDGAKSSSNRGSYVKSPKYSGAAIEDTRNQGAQLNLAQHGGDSNLAFSSDSKNSHKKKPVVRAPYIA